MVFEILEKVKIMIFAISLFAFVIFCVSIIAIIEYSGRNDVKNIYISRGLA